MECFLLAGGESKRFGEDKLLFRIGALRTIDYVLREASSVCEKVFIVTKDPTKFRDFGVPAIEDLLPYRTPLAGIYTALKVCSRDKALILSGDIPLIKGEVLKLVEDGFREPITVLSCGERIHPLVGMYSSHLYTTVEEYLREGSRSVMGFLERVGYNTIGEDMLKGVDPDLTSLTNMNTKEDLAKIVEILDR